MIVPVPLTAIVVAPSAQQLATLRRELLAALLRRGVSRPEAEDAIQGVLERLSSRPHLWAKLAAYGIGYFVEAAVNQHLMNLRAERSRRGREQRYVEGDSSASLAEIDPRRVRNALELAAAADLTAHQRQYLRYVLVEGRSIQEIAAMTKTHPRAVQGVLARATAAMRKHLEDTAP